MIPLTPVLNLGGDRTRMKNPDDVARQTETARQLLDRLYNEQSPAFMELQLLADEVGMGKTFVALAVAYSVLEAQKANRALPGCYQKILILVPQNDELMRKWQREVGEILKRCAGVEHQTAAQELFKAKTFDRPDELVAALRTGGERVLIAKTSTLGARVKDDDLKTQFTLATLFRCFGRKLPIETRDILLKGAPSDWPKSSSALGDLNGAALPFSPDSLELGLRRTAESEPSELEKLLSLCKEWGTPNVRGRDAGFEQIRKLCREFYKNAVWSMLGSDLPLVIVDEAHQWKNGKNHLAAFKRCIAPRTRRALLLTATPFQLHPSEILALLEVGDSLGIPKERHDQLKNSRTEAVKPALDLAQAESAGFAKKWSSLGARLDTPALHAAWESEAICEARKQLAKLADAPGALEEAAVEQVVQVARVHIDPELREFVSQALRLFAFNRDLGVELGRFVMRHRRTTNHRLVRAGNEMSHDSKQLKQRPDAHLLHAAPGIDVRGDDELPLYLLMRATSELENGKRTANLGSSLTGCYSTFFESAAGANFKKADGRGVAATYVKLLNDLVGDEAADATHPKVAPVVKEVVERWERGEKSLIFTFRVKTAARLYELIKHKIEERIHARRDQVLGGEAGLTRLQQRLSTKTQGLYQPMLDRVLWSMLWAPPDAGESPIASTSLLPSSSDYREIARLALVYQQDLLDKPADRVFLHRAVEHSLARRLRGSAAGHPRLLEVLNRMADASWVEKPYGGVSTPDEADELANEKGVQSTYERFRTPSEAEVEQLARDLIERDARARRAHQVGVVRQAFDGPSFWLGVEPEQQLLRLEHHPADVEVDRSDQRFLHVHLRELTWTRGNGELDFRTRALAFKAMRRAMLRESVLVRLLPKYEDLEDDLWSNLLVRHFTDPGAGRQESLLRLVGVFIEDLASASGPIDDPKSARGALYDATKRGEAVSIVKGDTPNDLRSRRFQGFNSPLLPEILICGQIAQEGIDLHRHCSHVVHYDLAWNPATLEQRTGRVDRIGSRTQRLRQLSTDAANGASPAADDRLEVNAPYLAGTYDERMFEELRLRSQVFEVLLGGDLSGTRTETDRPAREGVAGDSDAPDEDEGDERAFGLTALPEEMASSLRVDLSVWKASPGARVG
jgi:Helicase conserved C-terminal domain